MSMQIITKKDKTSTRVADFNVIAGAELPVENVAGDNCQTSHHKGQGRQRQQ